VSLSTETLRREIGEARDRVARLNRTQDQWRTRLEELEAERVEGRDAIEQAQSGIKHWTEVIEALQRAVSVLAEQLPGAIAAPAPKKPTSAREAADLVHYVAGGERQESVEEADSRRACTYVLQRAEELDLTQLADEQFFRADLVALVLVENGPMRQYEIAEHVLDLIDECSTSASARGMVSDILPVLVRQGRVKIAFQEGDTERYARWAAQPAEVASSRLGTNIDNFAGKTTSWPEGGRAPAVGSRIVVESGPFEQGRKR
jgi:hypothetical protein